MLYINKENHIYSGDLQDGYRALTDEELILFNRGYGYEKKDGQLIDISQNPEYIAEQEAKAKAQAISDLSINWAKAEKDYFENIQKNQILGKATNATTLINQYKLAKVEFLNSIMLLSGG